MSNLCWFVLYYVITFTLSLYIIIAEKTKYNKKWNYAYIRYVTCGNVIECACSCLALPLYLLSTIWDKPIYKRKVKKCVMKSH